MQFAELTSRQTDLKISAFEPDGDIAGHYADQNFNQRDRDSGPNGNQTAGQRQPHPHRSNEPDVLRHKLLSLSRNYADLIGVISSCSSPIWESKLHCLFDNSSTPDVNQRTGEKSD